jgi:hypothetical protein
MTSLTVYRDDSDTLYLADLDPGPLAGVVAAGGHVLWNRAGEWGKVPNSVLRDAMQHWADQHTLLARGRITAVPDWAGRVSWTQTVTPQLVPE